MTLLEKLGRGDCPNVQVQIFAAISNDVADTAYQSVKKTVHRRLVAEMSPQEQMVLSAVHQDAAQVEQVIGNYVEKVLEDNPFAVPVSERSKIVSDLKDEMLGLGPIEVLLKDPTVTEVMVNGPKKIFVERMGRLQLTDIQFHDDSHVMNIIERILSPIGRHIDESVPLVDARLEDGSRVNIIIPPLSLVGPCITIRKFATKALSVDNLILLAPWIGKWLILSRLVFRPESIYWFLVVLALVKPLP